MKFFQKKSVAVTVLVLAVIFSSVWGIMHKPAVNAPQGGDKLDTSLSSAAYEKFLVDDADILSGKTEKAINLYNANWDEKVGARIAVVTVRNAADVEDTAWDWAERFGLAEDDAILVIDAGTGDYRVVASGGFYDFFDSLPASFVDTYLAEGVASKDYNDAVKAFFGAVHVELSEYVGGAGNDGGLAGTAGKFIAVLIVVFLIWMFIDKRRYRRYEKRYRAPGMGVPTVAYHPIFFGHNWYTPAAPKPPKTSRRNYGNSGGSHSSRPGSSGFGSSSRPSSSFRSSPSSHRSSGSFGGGRGGGFGGSHSSGGSRSMGGGRSGSFGGGSRGGGFGGRR